MAMIKLNSQASYIYQFILAAVMTKGSGFKFECNELTSYKYSSQIGALCISTLMKPKFAGFFQICSQQIEHIRQPRQ